MRCSFFRIEYRDEALFVPQQMLDLFKNRVFNLGGGDTPWSAWLCLVVGTGSTIWRRQSVISISLAMLVRMGRSETVALVVIENTSQQARRANIGATIAGTL